jgi:hypothetical protein
MISALLLTAAVSCPPVKIVPPTEQYELTVQDIAALKRTRFGCKKIYGPKSCVKMFQIIETGRYRVLCTTPEKD